jgi:8-hydroxy-5-deazaflavin:NADPH oxidoreductase
VKIATIGSGNVGGGLGRMWESAGHEIQVIGREGGDVSDADGVLLAVAGGVIADALDGVTGLEGKTLVDATNLIQGEYPEGAESLAAFVKQQTGATVVKAFNTIFARTYDRRGEQRVRPSCLFCGDDEAKPLAAQLIADAGYEPVDCGGLDNARGLEDFVKVLFAVEGPPFYRVAAPGEL